jgi:hypothetical protein
MLSILDHWCSIFFEIQDEEEGLGDMQARIAALRAA